MKNIKKMAITENELDLVNNNIDLHNDIEKVENTKLNGIEGKEEGFIVKVSNSDYYRIHDFLCNQYQ